MPHGYHVDAIRVTHDSIDRLFFICSLKSVCPSPYLSVQVANISFVRPTVPSLLVISSLKSNSINSIRLHWDLPLSMGINLVYFNG